MNLTRLLKPEGKKEYEKGKGKGQGRGLRSAVDGQDVFESNKGDREG